MEQKLSYNKDNLDCYSKSFQGELGPDFISNFDKGIFIIPYKYRTLFIIVTLFIEEKYIQAYIVKDKYFILDAKSKTLNLKDYKGKIDAVNIISSLLVPATYNFVHEKKIFPKFVEIFFANIKDIMHFTKLLNIKEVSQFIESLFKLHKATDVQKISINEFISKSGGEQYIKDMIAGYMCTMSRFLTKSKNKQEYYLRIEDKLAELLKNIEYDLNSDDNKNSNKNSNKKDFVQNFMSYKNVSYFNSELDYFSLNCIKEIIRSIDQKISDIYISDYYNREEVNDIMYLIEGNPIYSKFLSAYSGVEKHYYKFQHTALINNTFYSEFLSLRGLLGVEVDKLLMINLTILMQNN